MMCASTTCSVQQRISGLISDLISLSYTILGFCMETKWPFLYSSHIRPSCTMEIGFCKETEWPYLNYAYIRLNCIMEQNHEATKSLRPVMHY